MIFEQRFLEGIRAGTITVAFRRWRRPSVKAGGTLLTAAGQLHIDAVDPVTPDHVSEADARRAGYANRQDLLIELNRRSEGELYRIALGRLEPDPRVALRERPATGSEQADLQKRLRRLDAKAPGGPWTWQDKDPFKINVRKLKNLGLTENLETGYRLSARGEALLLAQVDPTPG